VVAEWLGSRRLAFLHVDETTDCSFDWSAFRKRYPGVYIANAGYDFARADAAITRGHADLVSFGRLFLANPDLVRRFRVGAGPNRLDPCAYRKFDST
jgi:N-ethylmaleimide reductase